MLSGPAIPTPRQILRQTSSKKVMCTPIATASLYTITKTWKEPKCPLTEEWIKNMCVCVCIYIYIYIYTMQYYAAIKKNETVLFGAMWMDLEITIPSEVNQNKKDKYYTISLICGV